MELASSHLWLDRAKEYSRCHHTQASTIFDVVGTAWVVSRITKGVAPITAVIPESGSYNTEQDGIEHLLLTHGEPLTW